VDLDFVRTRFKTSIYVIEVFG